MSKKDLKSNPFDVLTQSAIELTRASLFFNARYRNKGYMDVQDIVEISAYYSRIKAQFDILKNMSQDEVDELRDMAYCNNNGNLDRINKVLFDIFNDLRTEYSDSFPFVSIEFEKFTLGEDSKEFKRREYLRNLCDSNKEITIEFLSSCNDYMNKGEEECKKYWGYTFTDDMCAKIMFFLQNNDIEEWELDYMSSYIEHK